MLFNDPKISTAQQGILVEHQFPITINVLNLDAYTNIVKQGSSNKLLIFLETVLFEKFAFRMLELII